MQARWCGQRRSGGVWLVVLLVSLLSACSGGYAPVTEQSLGARSTTPAPERYTVRRGDTLYAIAWRYGLDYRAVARLNGIDNRYIIYPGQKLRLKSSSSAAKASRAKNSSSASLSTQSSVAKTARPDNAGTGSSVDRSGKLAPTATVRWQWPVAGPLLARFSSGSTPNKGVDLAGAIGDPVRAAATGKVVYAGSGLLGYGNLVIVNHNEQYLSAYAHNSRIFVKEGDTVKAGDKIAEIGSTGTSRPMLHFEIRRDGKPVDPLKYLPKK